MTSGRRAVNVRTMKTGWQFSAPNHAGTKDTNLTLPQVQEITDLAKPKETLFR